MNENNVFTTKITDGRRERAQPRKKTLNMETNSQHGTGEHSVDRPVRVFWCIEQEPKPNEIGPCTVSVQHGGIALLMDAKGKEAIRRMDRAQIDWMHADGFMISGYEETGQTRQFKPIFRRQEWFCRYANA